MFTPIALRFTPMHLTLLAVVILIVISAIQGKRVATAADDSGASATVTLFSSIAGCLLCTVGIAVALFEIKISGVFVKF